MVFGTCTHLNRIQLFGSNQSQAALNQNLKRLRLRMSRPTTPQRLQGVHIHLRKPDGGLRSPDSLKSPAWEIKARVLQSASTEVPDPGGLCTCKSL